MPEIFFHVDGDPKPQLRPRAFIQRTAAGPQARVYTPGTAEEWKSLVVAAAKPHLPSDPIAGPVTLQLAFYFERPARLQRKKHLDGKIPCIGPRNDADNLAKAIMDCLTQVRLWADDGHVWRLLVSKQWAEKHGGRPGMDAWISWEDDADQPSLLPPRRPKPQQQDVRF